MARALWTGTLSFGLVSIPVEVHTAVRDHRLRFHLLRQRDRSRIKFQKVAERDGRVVGRDELVRGYEYARGHFIVLTDGDFKAAALERDRSVTILDFVRADAVDDRFFDRPYYLTPGRGGEQAYAVLREALRDTGLVGIAKFVLRDTQHLTAVEVIDQALVLSVLRFADELVSTSDLSFPAVSVRDKDLELARMLVDSLRTDWNPEQYTDEYRRNLLSIIDSKRKGAEPDLKDPQHAEHGQVVDLMERLRRSLEAAGGAPAAAAADRASRPAAKRERASGARPSRARAAARGRRAKKPGGRAA